MNQQQTALRLALEALTQIDQMIDLKQYHHAPPNVTALDIAQAAIQACQQALAEPQAQDEECGGCNGSGRMVRDPDIGTDQECFSCSGSGVQMCATPPASAQVACNVMREKIEKALIYLAHSGKFSRSSAKTVLNEALAAAPEAVGINGLTEAETSASMSVRGLSKPSKPGATK